MSSLCSKVCGSDFRGKSCSKILPVYVYPEGEPEKKTKVYAILDDQSNKTLIRSKLLNRMVEGSTNPLSTELLNYKLKSCNGVSETQGRKVKGLLVESFSGDTCMQLPSVIECDSIPDVREEIPTPEMLVHHPHLKHLASFIPPLDEKCDISLLIGRDLPEAFHMIKPCQPPRGSKGLPFAHQLPLGWVVIGQMKYTKQTT